MACSCPHSLDQQTVNLHVPVSVCKTEGRLTVSIAHVPVSIQQKTDYLNVAVRSGAYESFTAHCASIKQQFDNLSFSCGGCMYGTQITLAI